MGQGDFASSASLTAPKFRQFAGGNVMVQSLQRGWECADWPMTQANDDGLICE